MNIHVVQRSMLLSLMVLGLFSCSTTKKISLTEYYQYDHQLPLDSEVILRSKNANVLTYDVTFESVRDHKVTATLTYPSENLEKKYPVIIFMHGVGDHKERDYMEYGNQFLLDHDYAVLRLDIDQHGDRKTKDYDFSLKDGLQYWTRDVITQTVFDLQRAVDFIQTQPHLDANRIGYFGISLGGIIGTVFCGVDERVKVPVITLAGGNMHLIYGVKGLNKKVKGYFSVIDPINFVKKISPRPLLMVNAEHDEIVLPITSKFLYRKAKQPKEIIWYPSKHRDGPIDKIFGNGVDWYKAHL